MGSVWVPIPTPSDGSYVVVAAVDNLVGTNGRFLVLVEPYRSDHTRIDNPVKWLPDDMFSQLFRRDYNRYDMIRDGGLLDVDD